MKVALAIAGIAPMVYSSSTNSNSSDCSSRSSCRSSSNRVMLYTLELIYCTFSGCTGELKTKFMQDLKKFLFSKVEGGDR